MKCKYINAYCCIFGYKKKGECKGRCEKDE